MGLSRMPIARNRRVTIAIPDHIAWSLIPRKGLGDLTRDPLRCRVGCHVDPDEISAIKPYDDEAIQQLEAEAGHHKKVHGGNVWRVVSQKGLPALARRPTALDHVLSDARLRDLKPKLEQFAVNARRTPKKILHAHLPDQRAQFCLDLRAPSP